jgi:hypothetical protein
MKRVQMEGHAMSLVRNGFALSTRREFMGALFSALLALALFDPGVATAQQGKEIKLTEKHIQSFMSAYDDMAKVYESADPDKPDDPKLEAQAEAIAKKNGTNCGSMRRARQAREAARALGALGPRL